MALLVGKGCFPGIIDDFAIAKTLVNKAPLTLTIWQKIKEFFCRTNQTEAMSCLHKLCHPEPETTKSDTKALFSKLRELAYPGFEFFFQFNEYNEVLDLRLIDVKGHNLLTIRFENDYTVEWKDCVRFYYPLHHSYSS